MFSSISVFLINTLLPFAVQLVKLYIDSTASKNDDKILEVSKIGLDYLADKSNNTVTKSLSNALNEHKMRLTQGPL